METNKAILGILEDILSSVEIVLFAFTSKETRSLFISNSGFGGRGFGIKDLYSTSPERFVLYDPARLFISASPF
jgi:predicted transcriptional regulator YheO